MHEIVDIIEKSLPFTVTHEYIEGTPGDQMGVYGKMTRLGKIWGGKLKLHLRKVCIE